MRKGGARARGTPGFTRNVGNYRKTTKGELKYFDGETDVVGGLSGVPVGVTGTIVDESLNLIKQGTQPSQRIGRKVVVKRLQMRGHVRLQSVVAGITPNRPLRFRLIVYCDKQCNGAAGSAEQILQSRNNSADASVDKDVTLDNYRNMEYIDRYRIIYDKTHTLNPLTLSTADVSGLRIDSSGVYKTFNFGKNMNLEIIWGTVAASGTIDQIQSNNLGVMCIVDDNTQSEDWQLKYQWRLRYTD